ncbi:MAG: CRISPR-associated endoribonuclease Cas6 [Candidatus Bipolaricaulaceae bacterium]
MPFLWPAWVGGGRRVRMQRSSSEATRGQGRKPGGEARAGKSNSDALHAVVLRLVSKTSAKIPAGLGHRVHAAFFQMIEQVDPPLAEKLHASGRRQRPFTVSPLMGARRTDGDQISLSPERRCSLRVTMLEQEIYQRVAEYLLRPQRLPGLRLGDAELIVAEMFGTPDSSTWSGYATWESLVDEASDNTEVTLEFASPTVFRRGDLDLPLPVPELVFGSYFAKWRAFSPIPLDSALAEKGFFSRHVGVKEHRIHSVPFNDGRVTIPGFVGRCTFLMKGRLKAGTIRQVNALADFAFYAGTGRKTTHGMGMTRRIQ